MAPVPTLVVIDDEPLQRSAIARLFRGRFDVVEGSTAPAAVTSLAAGAPAAVLVDLRMPARGGLEIARQLRDEGYCGPVVILTGAMDADAELDAARAAGTIDAVISKPWTLAELEDAISRLVSTDARSPNASEAASSPT